MDHHPVPDVDKLIRLLCDALTIAGVIADDDFIVDIRTRPRSAGQRMRLELICGSSAMTKDMEQVLTIDPLPATTRAAIEVVATQPDADLLLAILGLDEA